MLIVYAFANTRQFALHILAEPIEIEADARKRENFT